MASLLNEELGAFVYIIPLVAGMICMATALDSFYRGNTRLGMGMILWFATMGILSYADPFGQKVPGEWMYGIGPVIGFLVFACLLVIPVATFVGLYKLVPWFETYILSSIPPSYYIGLQVCRLSGCAFLYMYLNGTMTNFVGLQAGLLDIVLGITALPLSWWWWACKKEEGKYVWVFLLWSGLGLYDLISAFVLVFLNFIGWYSTEKELSYFLFYPLSLFVLYQIPIAMATDILFLTQYHRLGTTSSSSSSQEEIVLDQNIVAAPDYGSTKKANEEKV